MNVRGFQTTVWLSVATCFFYSSYGVAQAPQWLPPSPHYLEDFKAGNPAQSDGNKGTEMAMSDVPVNEVPNQAAERLMVGGQPTEEQIRALPLEGFDVVVNMRPNVELQDFPEQAIVESAGMIYEHLPILGPQDISFENSKKLADILDQYTGKNIVVHCASGNRVGALFALKAFYVDQHDLETSLQIGDQHGLTKLRPLVESILTKAGGQ